MTTQFSDFLAAHAARIADLWDREAQSIVVAAQQPEATHGPRQFINTVLVALSADDLRPLVAFYKLAPGVGLDQRLDTGLRHLHALRRATDTAAEEEGLDATAA